MNKYFFNLGFYPADHFGPSSKAFEESLRPKRSLWVIVVYVSYVGGILFRSIVKFRPASIDTTGLDWSVVLAAVFFATIFFPEIIRKLNSYKSKGTAMHILVAFSYGVVAESGGLLLSSRGE